MNLNIEDVDLLIEAMDTWVGRSLAGDMMTDMLSSLIEKDQDKLKQRQELNKLRREEQRKSDAEKATLLKAKLIELKHQILKTGLPTL